MEFSATEHSINCNASIIMNNVSNGHLYLNNFSQCKSGIICTNISANITIEENYFFNNTCSIHFLASNHSHIQKNRILLGDRGISLQNCTDIEIWLNSLYNLTYGILLNHSDNNLIDVNSLKYNQYGIYLSESDWNTVSFNYGQNLINNIYEWSCSNNIFINNFIDDEEEKHKPNLDTEEEIQKKIWFLFIYLISLAIIISFVGVMLITRRLVHLRE